MRRQAGVAGRVCRHVRGLARRGAPGLIYLELSRASACCGNFIGSVARIVVHAWADAFARV